MAKYRNVQTDIEGVFATSNWTGNGIQAYPSNYQGGSFADEFVKVEIIPGRPLLTYGSPGVQGQVIIQIYTRAGDGISRSIQIADILDTLLQVQTLPSGTTTGTSSITFLGIDSQDNSLFRADYSVSFRRY